MTISDYKLGIYSEKQFVELFGTDSIKKSYMENKRLISNQKKTVLNKAKKYCEVKELKNRRYKIVCVYEFPIPSNFNKMNRSLYKYTVPLILQFLINGHDQNNKIDISVGKWAREISMVNCNYRLAKNNKEDTCSLIDQPLSMVSEFFSKADEMIEWYIINTLDYLKSAGLIIWREVTRIVEEVVDDNNICIDETGNIDMRIKLIHKQASKAEMKYYAQCIDIADKAANIQNASERYYSKKKGIFLKELNRELYKKKIKGIYNTYEAYYINLDKCKFVLSQFEKIDPQFLIPKFNEEFTNMIVENAGKRFELHPSKYKKYPNKEEYTFSFKELCNITIDEDTEYLGDRIREKGIEDQYTLSIKGD